MEKQSITAKIVVTINNSNKVNPFNVFTEIFLPYVLRFMFPLAPTCRALCAISSFLLDTAHKAQYVG
jgi:hypothetical protein